MTNPYIMEAVAREDILVELAQWGIDPCDA